MVSWLFLTFGLTLGMIWAYEELGWGGYWMWDPVENAGLLPWFTATAFLHSVMVQERRSMLRIWNVTLVIVTFFLTIFGTFMTRSGVVQSVHAFGEDSVLAWLFTGFMVAILTFSFGLVIYRLPLLKSRNELDSWVSREAAFMVNNWILLFSAFFILFGTMFPTLSEAITGTRLTVAAPFFNKWMAPIGLILLFLTGVGPLLGWRKTAFINLRNQFMWPTTFGVVAAGALLAFGLRNWASVSCFALSAFVFGTILQEFAWGANIRRKNTGTDFLTALIGLVGRNKRRYGGYIVHIGIVLMFIGFAGGAYKIDQQTALKLGDKITVGSYTIRNDGIKVNDDGQRQMTTAYLSVFEEAASRSTRCIRRGGRSGSTKTRRRPRSPFAAALAKTSTSSCRRTIRRRCASQVAPLEIIINPLVELDLAGVWRHRVRHGHRAPARACVLVRACQDAGRSGDDRGLRAACSFLAARGCTRRPGCLRAPSSATQTSHYPRTEFERQMQHEIVCTCGCGHVNIARVPQGSVRDVA